MNIDQFWHLIEQSRSVAAKSGARVRALEESIRVLPAREIVSFEGHCWDLLSLSLKRELWAVATIIQPSCTSASFDAMRAWMILEGRDFFDQVTAKPERLAERCPRGQVSWAPDGDLLLRLVPRIYHAITGEDLPTLPRTVPYVLKGQRWTEFDLPEMYPELWKKYRL